MAEILLSLQAMALLMVVVAISRLLPAIVLAQIVLAICFLLVALILVLVEMVIFTFKVCQECQYMIMLLLETLLLVLQPTVCFVTT